MKLWLFLPVVTSSLQTWPLRWQHLLTRQESWDLYGFLFFFIQTGPDVSSAVLQSIMNNTFARSPFAVSLLGGLLFGLTVFFFEAWFWLCSLHFFNWKLMNFHIIQACVRQMAARQVILRGKTWFTKALFINIWTFHSYNTLRPKKNRWAFRRIDLIWT